MKTTCVLRSISAKRKRKHGSFRNSLHDFAKPFEWFTRLANTNTEVLAIGHRFGSTGVERE